MSERRLDANLSPQTFALEQAKYVFLTITAIRLNTQCSLTKSIYRECINSNMNIETFNQFRQRHLEEENKVSISEGRFLSNLFSLSQGARHKSYSSKLSSSLSNIRSIANSIKNTENEKDFYNLMSNLILQLADVFNAQSGQSSSNITTNVASAVLSQNYKKDIEKIKKKLKVK